MLFQLKLRFHGDLPIFVRPKRLAQQVVRQLHEKTSIKDAIEACGVPHPEIDLILVDDAPVDFAYQLHANARIEVYPVPAPAELFPANRLQRRGRRQFVADGHLGKLTRDLRLLGIDVAYSPLASDAELVALSVAEERALLTRDRPLLMHAAVRDGYYPRSQSAEEQTREVICRFELTSWIAPFTRCLRCNNLLAAISKAEVFEQLEPLTKIYYQTFRRCPACRQIYWGGSHFAKLQKRIERLLANPG
ncbi:Mut7-C RNAse domain-containing protein [soil metagenome]